MEGIGNDQLSVGKNYYDFQGLNQLKKDAGDPNSDEALKQVAKQFESMFINMMIKSMRDANAVFAENNMLNSHSSQMYQGMHDQQLSIQMSEQGGLGLSDLLVNQLKGIDSAAAAPIEDK